MRLIDADNLPYKLALNENGEQVIYVRAQDINAAPEFVRWIPVSERLPDTYSEKILVTDGTDIQLSYRSRFYKDGNGNTRVPANYGNGMNVTHWMPLPDAPEEETNV